MSDELDILDIFELAMNTPADEIAVLPESIRGEVIAARRILDAIDTSWQVPQLVIDRVQELFLEKLAARDLQHPWIQEANDG